MKASSLSLLLCAVLALAACSARHRPGSGPRLVISEFMAVNGGTLTDADGDPSDWIEVHNRGPAEASLRGWYLTDDRTDPVKWRFPDVHVPAFGSVLVFASGKDRAVVGEELHTNFRLSESGEYLALVEPDGWTIAWEYAPAYPQQFEGVSYGLVADLLSRYLTVPTPGTINEGPAENRGPVLGQVSHTPREPEPGDWIVIRASVRPSLAPVASVTLHCRAMFGATQAVPMYDDGAHDDGGAQDGVYGAVIPPGLAGAGDMMRYYVTANDRQGQASRWPLYQDELNSPQYCGFVVRDPGVASQLPVLYWFVADPAAAETDAGTRASIYYRGTFYDNVLVRLRGLTARYWPKKSFKFDLNQGYHFQFSPDEAPVEEFNLNSTVTDKAYVRQVLALETYRDAGVPASISFPVRVQQNGAFYSVSIWIEQPDERFLERQGLDPNGALYKLLKLNILESSTVNVAKRTRLDEDHGDLQALIDGLQLPAEQRAAYLYDHVDIPEVINYLAVAAILHDRDQGDNNYYMYRDTEGNGEWMVLPWDKDMTFGRTYLPEEGGTFNDVIWADRDPPSHPLRGYYVGNRLFDALLETPGIQEMYLRRLRTVMDAFLQPPETPMRDRYYEGRIRALYEQMAPDVALDAERWPLNWGEPQTFAQALEAIETDYLPARRVHLYETHGPPNDGIIPAAQAANARLRFGELVVNPLSGDQDEEYLTLVNDNDYAVDISGWKVVSDVEYTFQPGVVVPASGTLYLSPDVGAFRARSRSPTGGERLSVQGDYRGRLSNAWGRLRLYNAAGRLVTAHIFVRPGTTR
jgi:hypothetical protein